MKRNIIQLVIICFCNITVFGQKKYEMVVQKTDGTETVISVENIVKTFFREIESSGEDPQNDFELVGNTWCYGSTEEEALDNANYHEGYVFYRNGKCTYFAFYGSTKQKRGGTYTYNDGKLNISSTTSYDWKGNQWVQNTNYRGKTRNYNVSISGNCMIWTGDDNETLYTRKGFSVDLGESDENNNEQEQNEDEGNDEELTTDDPEGTITKICYPNLYFDELFGDEGKRTVYCDKNKFYSYHSSVKVVDLGEVNGLSSITTYPTSGWNKDVTQTVGHGYVFRYINPSTGKTTYARVFIVEQTERMTYKVKFQTPFVINE